jgi:hypothetical protein
MAWASVEQKEYGDLVTAADMNQIKENLDLLKRKVSAAPPAPGNVRAFSIANGAWILSSVSNWQMAAGMYVNLVPDGEKSTPKFLVVVNGVLQAHATSATMTVGAFDVYSTTGAVAAPVTGNGIAQIRTVAAGVWEYQILSYMTVLQHVSGQTLKVFPIMKITAGAATMNLRWFGTVYYKEL